MNSKVLNFLVVDDEPEISESIQEIIAEDLEQNCRTSLDGEKALEEINKGDIQVVYTDYHMPQLNGVELVEKINELPEEKKPLHIVILSGETQELKSHFGTRENISYLNKPVQFEELCDFTENLIKKLL